MTEQEKLRNPFFQGFREYYDRIARHNASVKVGKGPLLSSLEVQVWQIVADCFFSCYWADTHPEEEEEEDD